MEIGSFLELDLNYGPEFFTEEETLTRLNSGRAGIYHAIKCFGCTRVFIPYYMCPSVPKFLLNHGIDIIYYNIKDDFTPLLNQNDKDTCVIVVNYFGLFSQEQLMKISNDYKNVIIDNSQAFFADPIFHDNFLNVYSTRKFFGVPDGSYVIGNFAKTYTADYPQDQSAQTSLFLLKRLEVGSSASYNDRMENERRIDSSGVLKMSKLTRKLLQNIDYAKVKSKRRNNFLFAEKMFSDLNKLEISFISNKASFPMVYPLVIENKELLVNLQSKNIYTGRWWNHVLRFAESNDFEKYLSSYMLPIPIDQRYGEQELRFIRKAIETCI